MKMGMFALCLCLTTLCSAKSQETEVEYYQKVRLQPEQIFVENNSIKVFTQDQVLNVRTLECDEDGLFVILPYMGWHCDNCGYINTEEDEHSDTCDDCCSKRP